MLKFRDGLLKGKKVCPWEALLEIFVIFEVPLGSGGAPFLLKKAYVVRSEILMIFGVSG